MQASLSRLSATRSGRRWGDGKQTSTRLIPNSGAGTTYPRPTSPRSISTSGKTTHSGTTRKSTPSMTRLLFIFWLSTLSILDFKKGGSRSSMEATLTHEQWLNFLSVSTAAPSRRTSSVCQKWKKNPLRRKSLWGVCGAQKKSDHRCPQRLQARISAKQVIKNPLGVPTRTMAIPAASPLTPPVIVQKSEGEKPLRPYQTFETSSTSDEIVAEPHLRPQGQSRRR